MEAIRNPKINSTTETSIWVCASVQDNHDWMSKFSLVLQDKRNSGSTEVRHCAEGVTVVLRAQESEQRFA